MVTQMGFFGASSLFKMDESKEILNWIRSLKGYVGVFNNMGIDPHICVMCTPEMTDEIKDSIRKKFNREVRFRLIEEELRSFDCGVEQPGSSSGS